MFYAALWFAKNGNDFLDLGRGEGALFLTTKVAELWIHAEPVLQFAIGRLAINIWAIQQSEFCAPISSDLKFLFHDMYLFSSQRY